MNILRKALDDIKFSIPNEILKIAFQDAYNWRQSPSSIDELMLNKVIRSRVLVDADIVGGQMILVPLDGIVPRYENQFTLVFDIPAERLMHRSIISVLSVSYLPNALTSSQMGAGIGYINPNTMNDVSSAAQRISNSMSNIPPVSNAFIELIGDNVIMIRDELRMSNIYLLRCIVANESNLNNINIRSYGNFSKLCILAVKAYIYNKLIINIDSAYLSGGQELGAVRSYIETLSDSNQMYNDFLNEVWRPTAYMNDTPSYNRLLRMMVNPGI